jgi:predicted Zn-dependent protease
VAGVLAHEVQHVVLRHSVRAAVRDLGWRATLGLVFGSSPDLRAVSALAGQLGTLRFSRQQEAEADERGVQLLIRAGIDSHGLASFFERLDRATGEVPAFLSTHPSSGDRARRVRELSGSFTAAPLGYDWSAVQADLKRAPAARRGS